jgi:hypothetical protein
VKGGVLTVETFSTVVFVPAWFLAVGLWIYGVWCFSRALKRTAPGVDPKHAWLWRDQDLSAEGHRYRRRGICAFFGFVAVVVGVFALSWALGLPTVQR